MDAEQAKINLESQEKEMIEGEETLKTTKEQAFEFGVEGERACAESSNHCGRGKKTGKKRWHSW